MTIDDVIRIHPWAEIFRGDMRERCPDCAAPLGEPHSGGCDVARCRTCGGQRISCGCPDYVGRRRDRWMGLMYFDAHRLCAERDLWCRTLIDDDGGERPVSVPDDLALAMEIAHGRRKGSVRWHVPCKREDAGAGPDLNRACTLVVRGGIRRN
jgi:hypothetical protein